MAISLRFRALWQTWRQYRSLILGFAFQIHFRNRNRVRSMQLNGLLGRRTEVGLEDLSKKKVTSSVVIEQQMRFSAAQRQSSRPCRYGSRLCRAGPGQGAIQSAAARTSAVQRGSPVRGWHAVCTIVDSELSVQLRPRHLRTTHRAAPRNDWVCRRPHPANFDGAEPIAAGLPGSVRSRRRRAPDRLASRREAASIVTPLKENHICAR